MLLLPHPGSRPYLLFLLAAVKDVVLLLPINAMGPRPQPVVAAAAAAAHRGSVLHHVEHPPRQCSGWPADRRRRRLGPPPRWTTAGGCCCRAQRCGTTAAAQAPDRARQRMDHQKKRPKEGCVFLWASSSGPGGGWLHTSLPQQGCDGQPRGCRCCLP
jgi:hypothetical protein